MASKILWLCSWYPNEEHPFDGDFVQRYAEAVSMIQPIDVLYVHKYLGTQPIESTQKIIRNQNLHEHILINQVGGESKMQTLIGLIKYLRLHVKFIKENGKPDLIHVQIPMKAGVVALLFKWLYKIPYIVTEHYGIYNPRLENHFKTRNGLYRTLTKWVLQHADCLTTVSRSLGEDINDWVLKKKFEVIPNVVDTRLFHYEEPIQKDRFQFIHISNMIPLKNVAGIIQATEMLWKERQDFKLVFVGSIVDEFYQAALSKGLLNQVIYFEGEISYEKVSSKMKESDAMIIFSDTESQSCVVLESLCCGRPAIVTDIGGVKELIHDENGYKVQIRDTQDLLNKMRAMIDNYAKFNLKQISQQAIEQYAYQKVASQFVACYDSVLKK